MSQPGPSSQGNSEFRSGRPPAKYTMMPSEWKLELPEMGSGDNSQFGGCRRIEDAYERLVHVGGGTYGDVFKAIDKETREQVAVKRIKIGPDGKEGFPITAIREIKILSKLAHCEDKISGQLLRDNIIKLKEIVRSDSHQSNEDKGTVYMVFDFMDHDMAGLLDRANRLKAETAPRGSRTGPEPPFQLGEVKRYMKQLFLGLALLQMPKNNILHRDLKNANLLVSSRGELKIADFGLARGVLQVKAGGGGGGGGADDGVRDTPQGRKNLLMTNRVITLWYRPPELLLGADQYGNEVDMWSAGCIMAEVLIGRALFPGQNEKEQIDQIGQILGRMTDATIPGCTSLRYFSEMVKNNPAAQRWPAVNCLRARLRDLKVTDELAIDLLEKLITLNPADRISAADAAGHAWFSAEPKMFSIGQMPQYDSSHEMTMKKKREAEKQAYGQHQQRQQQQQQQQRHFSQQDEKRQRTAGGGGGGGGGYASSQGQYGRGAPAGSKQPTWNQERR